MIPGIPTGATVVKALLYWSILDSTDSTTLIGSAQRCGRRSSVKQTRGKLLP